MIPHSHSGKVDLSDDFLRTYAWVRRWGPISVAISDDWFNQFGNPEKAFVFRVKTAEEPTGERYLLFETKDRDGTFRQKRRVYECCWGFARNPANIGRPCSILLDAKASAGYSADGPYDKWLFLIGLLGFVAVCAAVVWAFAWLLDHVSGRIALVIISPIILLIIVAQLGRAVVAFQWLRNYLLWRHRDGIGDRKR
ncbi:MAG: hypothetical protein WC943_06395 [Elusimicrobiota bacterium]|jgi:hypothetical protein